MNNADKFKQIFDMYATELWAMSEKDFLAWLNAERDVPDTNVVESISRQRAIEKAREMLFPDLNLTERLVKSLKELPTIVPDTDPITQKALEAGKRGEEVRFYIDGRKFAVRELAQ